MHTNISLTFFFFCIIIKKTLLSKKRCIFIIETFNNSINNIYGKLTKSEKNLADFILDNIDITRNLSILDLSKISNTSASTISRFAKKLGYKNFQTLRASLYVYNDKKDETSFFKQIDYNSSAEEITNYIFNTSQRSLSQTKKSLNMDMLIDAVQILCDSKKCGIFGLGGSSIVTLNFYHRFLRSSLDMIYACDFHLQLMNAGKLTKDDCAFIISHSGINSDILRIMDILKEKKCRIITVTGNGKSPVALKSDIVICSVSEEVKYRPEAFSSIDAQICIVDSLFTIYALKVDKNPDIFTQTRKIINDTRVKY